MSVTLQPYASIFTHTTKQHAARVCLGHRVCVAIRDTNTPSSVAYDLCLDWSTDVRYQMASGPQLQDT